MAFETPKPLHKGKPGTPRPHGRVWPQTCSREVWGWQLQNAGPEGWHWWGRDLWGSRGWGCLVPTPPGAGWGPGQSLGAQDGSPGCQGSWALLEPLPSLMETPQRSLLLTARASASHQEGMGFIPQPARPQLEGFAADREAAAAAPEQLCSPGSSTGPSEQLQQPQPWHHSPPFLQVSPQTGHCCVYSRLCRDFSLSAVAVTQGSLGATGLLLLLELQLWQCEDREVAPCLGKRQKLI